ncbi:S-layer family protein [Scytonema sp. PRP1]|uniref:S-layer family protein n=1 Tax=Scytonema sp. PRP1 TaxID=3120513 RepID=UPI002FCEE489
MALVGGDVEIQGGTLTAEQGRIELGSVRNGQVWLNPLSEGFALSYPRIQSFGNIRLLQQALADASAGGSVQVHGNQVSLNDGSIILIQNQGQQQGGSISVNAAYSVNLSGHNSTDSLNGGLNSETIGNGHGADIAITAQQLVLQQGAVIIASSYGSGKTGNITVNADSKVQVIAFSPPNPINNSVIAATTSGSGDGGDITLSTGQLTILNGGGIGTQVLPKSTGRGGDVTINARESTEVIGAAVLPEGITVSSVAAITTGDGNAGKVIINTPRLVAENGGSVSTSTIEAAGSAGSLIINATESVDVRGGVQQRISTPSVDGEFSYLSLVGASGIVTLLGTPEAVRGASGNVTINTSSLSVTNGAGIEVSNQGTGDAGNLQINAKSVVLDSGGAITAATASGEGGNIQLQVRDLLLIRRNSEITASASGTGNGGNININTPFLVAVPNENSNISANSVNARGGNVTINTNGIFGFQFRPQGTLLSNITATGGNSALNGTVRINVENIIPTSGLVKLPSVLVDINALIANSCIARNSQKSRFIITGSGSLPTLPDELANSGFPTYELVPSTSDLPIGIQQSNNSNQSHAAIVEPDGIYQLSNGEVVLGRSCR